MEILFIALFLAVSGIVNIACFVIGAKVGQTVAYEEKIELPQIKSPMQLIAEEKEKKVAKEEEQKMEILLQNIENYNGTAAGQKDFR